MYAPPRNILLITWLFNMASEHPRFLNLECPKLEYNISLSSPTSLCEYYRIEVCRVHISCGDGGRGLESERVLSTY